MNGDKHPDSTIKTDTIIQLATAAVDQALVLVKLLPTQLQVDEDSKLHKSLAEMRRVLLVSLINKVDVGIQVITKDVDINAEADTSKQNEIVNNAPDTHVYCEKDTTQCTGRSDTSVEVPNGSNRPENEIMQESMDISNDLENSDINETNVSFSHIDRASDSKGEIMNQETLNMQPSPEITAEEKTPAQLAELDSSKRDSILNLVKPRDYKPKPREKVTVVGNWEDCKRLLNIASNAMLNDDYVKARRMAEKSERIYPTPAGKTLLEQIHIATEAKEESSRLDAEYKERAADALAAKKRKKEETAEALITAESTEKETLLSTENSQRDTDFAVEKSIIAAQKTEREALLAAEKTEREAPLATETTERKVFLATENSKREAVLAAEKTEIEAFLAAEKNKVKSLLATLKTERAVIAAEKTEIEALLAAEKNKVKSLLATLKTEREAPYPEFTREARFRFTVENISQMKDDVLSPPCYVRGLPWKIMVQKRNSTTSKKSLKILGLYLQCNSEWVTPEWSCYAWGELKLISNKPGGESICRNLDQTYNMEENEWGFRNFILWKDLMDPKNGFVKDNTITVEAHVIVD